MDNKYNDSNQRLSAVKNILSTIKNAFSILMKPFQQPLVKQGANCLSSLLFPSICSFCDQKTTRKQPIEGVCLTCTAQIPFRPASKTRVKCLEQRNSEDITRVFKENIDVIIVCNYEKMIRKALVSMKFYEAAYMKHAFGSMICHAVSSRNDRFDGIIPIPLHAGRLMERGYNQAELIAQKASELMKIPMLEDCLYREKKTKRQSEMEHYSDRLQNVSDAFICTHPEKLIGKKILLLDDILTSGETMISAANAIRKSMEKYKKESGNDSIHYEITGIALASSRK